jgi:ATP-dependent Clp protease ATP-binding subunit ClpC
MYERFSDAAREAMRLAVAGAQRFGHEYVGTEHILLGLVQANGRAVALVLECANVRRERLLQEMEGLLAPASEPVPRKRKRRFFGLWMASERPRFTLVAKRAIEHAIAEARDLRSRYIGADHVLLGLLREREGLASALLENLGMNLDDARNVVLRASTQGRQE